MKKLTLLLLILGSFIFATNVNAQVGCCVGNVVTGTAFCPNDPEPLNWYCTNTSTAYGCGGLDYSTCVNTRPSSGVECGQTGVTCTGCGWSTTACSGGGGGGGGGIGEPCSSDSDCSSGRCSAQRGICVDAGGFICPEDPVYCPSGTVRTATVVRSSCLNPKCTAGSAQTIGDCCSGHWNKGACTDWYDCPTRNNPNKVCRDCEDDEFICTTQNYITYRCDPVCSVTSPTNVVVTPISLTSSRVTWTPGNNNIRQGIYVSPSKSAVVARVRLVL